MPAVAGGISRDTSMDVTQQSSVNTFTFTWPVAPKKGQLLILCVAQNGLGGGGLNYPSGYSYVTGGAFASSARACTMFYKFADGSEGTTLTISSTSGTANQFLVIGTAYSGFRSFNSIGDQSYFTTNNRSSTIQYTDITMFNPTLTTFESLHLGVMAINAAWGTPTINNNSAFSVTTPLSITYSTSSMAMTLFESRFKSGPIAAQAGGGATFSTSKSSGGGGMCILSQNGTMSGMGIGA